MYLSFLENDILRSYLLRAKSFICTINADGVNPLSFARVLTLLHYLNTDSILKFHKNLAVILDLTAK